MSPQVQPSLASLYEEDETAWLEQTAQLIAEGRFEELDRHNLREYLCDMARRDRREVFSRLRVLLTHLLKWEYQPDHRSNSWRSTIRAQQRELSKVLKSGTLRRHASDIFAEAYQDAVEQAAIETEMPEEAFPSEPALTLDQVTSKDLTA